MTKNDKTGDMLVILGLDDVNLERLQRDEPIAFEASSVGIKDPRGILIFFHNGECPEIENNKEKIARKFMTVIQLDDESIGMLKDNQVFAVKQDKIEFAVMRGDSNEIEGKLLKAGLIGPTTKVIHEGYAPGDLPFSNN
jgi:hypothetical protein